MDECGGDSPERLMKSEVGCAIYWIEHPISLIGGGGVTVLFAVESGPGGEIEEERFEELLDCAVHRSDEGSVGLLIDGHGFALGLSDFGSLLEQRDGGFCDVGVVAHGFIMVALVGSSPGPVAVGEELGYIFRSRAGIAQW